LAVSVSTGNEADVKLGEAIDAISSLGEVRVVLTLIETVRDGPVFIESVRSSLERGKPVVACRIGTGSHGKTLMTTHTGALAVPERVLEGVLASLGVVVAETPEEAYEIAEIVALAAAPAGDRVGIVTHSGGIAIHLADLAQRHGLDLSQPAVGLRSRLDPLLELGAANNPLDMGGIIGGPSRFAEVVDVFARSGEYDLVLAVSTAHPPAHTEERVTALLGLAPVVPVVHLWMAGDQANDGLRRLLEAGAAVTEEPRAAMGAVSALARLRRLGPRADVQPLIGRFEEWGLPLAEGEVATTAAEAIHIADGLGYPVVVKVSSPGLTHKTEVGGVVLDLRDSAAVAVAFDRVVAAARSAGLNVEGARVERFRPGLEVLIGALIDPIFGAMASVGIGGVFTELLDDVTFAPAPVDETEARAMIDRLSGRSLLDGHRGSPAADIDELARIVSVVSRGLVGSGLEEVEVNPLVWADEEWVAVDWVVSTRA
jgi:acyl-CoA synthetase (NDP forming)